MMKNICLLFIFFAFTSCQKRTYQNDDLKIFSGEWNIAKVAIGTNEELFNFGTFTINEDGTGSMLLRSHDYSDTGDSVHCIFAATTQSGRDRFLYLEGLKIIGPDGKATEYLCYRGDLNITVEKLKKKKMTLSFGSTHNLYPCIISGVPQGKKGILWYLEKN